MARKYEERTAKPTNDAYTGMLALSFLALVVGSTFLYLQYSQYGDKDPPALSRKAEPPPPPDSQGTPPETKKTEDDDEKKADDKKGDDKKGDDKKADDKKGDDK